jgi:hypothetical protein
MPDINPISSNEDIMNEAMANKPQPSPQPAPQPVNTQPIPATQPVPAPSPNIVSAAPAQPQPQPTSPVPVAPVASQPASYRPPVASVAQSEIRGFFSYKLPVTSYILAVFYIIAAASLLWLLIQLQNQISQYSYSGSSSYYSTVMVPISLLAAAAVGITVSLFSRSKQMWYVAIVLSIGIICYEIYLVGQIIDSISRYSYGSVDVGKMIGQYIGYYSIYFLPYIPYLLLPPVTIGYLLTPKAKSAYR